MINLDRTIRRAVSYQSFSKNEIRRTVLNFKVQFFSKDDLFE